MQTFKCFFKVVASNMLQTIIVTGVFIVIAMIIGAFDGGQESMFRRVSASIGIVNRDNHPITHGLLDYLESLHTLIPMEDDMLALEDAIFFEQVRYVLIIDEGFGDGFASGNDNGLSNIAAPHNFAISVFIERQIDLYMQTMRGYLAARFTYDQANYLTRHDLRQEVNITSPLGSLVPSRYFDALVFILVSLIVISLTPSLTAFKRKDLADRLAVSPETARNRTLSLTMGCICLAMVIWVLVMIPAYFLHHESLFSPCGWLHLLNSFTLVCMCVGIAVLMAQLTENTTVVISAATLGGVILGFTSGAFVPLDIMSEEMRIAARFTPSYWYGYNNLLLIESLVRTDVNMPNYWLGIGIQLGFTAAFFTVALVLGSERVKNV